MVNKNSNIVLIGMPGSGKSTVGVILAKKMSLSFLDTDVLIQTSRGKTLQEIVDIQGYAVLREVEEKVLLDLAVKNHVIATGGSAVYSDGAIARLKSDSLMFFLDVDLATLRKRVGDFKERGLARPPNQSFDELYEERLPLYRKYADITIKCTGMTQEDVCDKIIKEVMIR